MSKAARSQSLFRSTLPVRGLRAQRARPGIDQIAPAVADPDCFFSCCRAVCDRILAFGSKMPTTAKSFSIFTFAEGKTGLENTIASVWLDSVAQQTEKLGGSVRRIADQDATLMLPFFNAKDLEAKFNQLLQTEWHSSGAQKLPTIVSRLKLRSGNWILWQRIVLDYELNLRSLSPLAQENLSLDPSKLLQLEFSLNTPGNAKSLNSENPPILHSEGKKLTWKLRPGAQHHLQAVFWVPSPLGIGAAVIGLLVIVGAIVRTHPLPAETVTDSIATE